MGVLSNAKFCYTAQFNSLVHRTQNQIIAGGDVERTNGCRRKNPGRPLLARSYQNADLDKKCCGPFTVIVLLPNAGA